MKRLTAVLALAFFCANVTAQDSTATKSKRDTIRIGNILIIKKGGKRSEGDSGRNLIMERHDYSKRKNARVTTNWWILDLGFSNYSDKTDYTNTGDYLVNRPGSPDLAKSDFKLRTGKSINVNIWVFMQRLALIKNNVNLKYGLGFELNNYRYKSDISYKEDGPIPYSAGMMTNAPFVFRDSISFNKNKLAADYITVPLMLNFTTNPYRGSRALSASFGVSAGYLYSQRNKQKSDERGKMKNKGDYDLNRFKFSYVGELGLGPVKLYGSYSPESMYDNNMDMRPYTLGIRLSNF